MSFPSYERDGEWTCAWQESVDLCLGALASGAGTLDRSTCDGVFDAVKDLVPSDKLTDARRWATARLAHSDTRASAPNEEVANYIHQRAIDLWDEHPTDMGLGLAKPGAPYTYLASEGVTITTTA